MCVFVCVCVCVCVLAAVSPWIEARSGVKGCACSGLDHRYEDGVCECGAVAAGPSKDTPVRVISTRINHPTLIDPIKVQPLKAMCSATHVSDRVLRQRIDNFVAHIALGRG